MKMMFTIMCLFLTGILFGLSACASKGDPSDHHDQAVRKMADQEFENRITY
jgi:hypothetical protein